MFSRHLPYAAEDRYSLPIPAELKDWIMAAFHIYGDESGKMSGKSDYTSFCGFVAHITEAHRVSAEWDACRLRWQVPPIHMARVMVPLDRDTKDDDWKKVKQEWGSLWEKKRDIMLRELSEIAKSASIACVGAVVDTKYFRELAGRDPVFKELHKDPIHMAFHFFVMGGLDKIERVDRLGNIGITVDDDPEFAMRVYEQFDGLRKTFDRVKNRIQAISFVNDQAYPMVQLADMIAYECRHVMVERLTKPDATSELYDNLTLMRTHQPGFYTPEILDDLAGMLKESNAKQQTEI